MLQGFLPVWETQLKCWVCSLACSPLVLGCAQQGGAGLCDNQSIPCCGITPVPLLWNIGVRCHGKGWISISNCRDFFFFCGSSLADQFSDPAGDGFEWFQVLCNYIDACFPICNLIPLLWDLLNSSAQKIAVSVLISSQWVYFLWQGLSQLLKF